MDYTNFLDMMVKVSLIILSVALGIFLKTYSDRKRLRALIPIVLELTEEAALKCTEAFCVADVKEVDSSLETAFRETAEIIKLGIHPVNKWNAGARFLQQINIIVKRVIAVKDDEKAAIKSLEMLRKDASKLLTWVKDMKESGH